MFKNRFLVIALAALVLIALLVVAGLAVHYVGWSEGYAAGQVALEGDGDEAVPYGPFGLRLPGRPRVFAPYFLGVGPILRIVLLIVLFVIVVKLFRFVIWGVAGFPMMAGMMAARPWHRHARHMHWHPHGPVPPGFQGWEQWWGENAGGSEPDAQAGETAA